MYLISNTVDEDIEVDDNHKVGADLFLVLEDSNGDNEFMEFFGGKIPSGILTEGEFIYMYCPQIYDTMDNYQQVNGIVYYANNVLHIVPNTDSYKVFYEIGGCNPRIEQKILILNIYLPNAVPESYDDPLEGLEQILDLMEITLRYTETENILFVSDVWDYDKENTNYCV